MNDRFILGTVQLGIPYGINNRHGKPSKEDAFAILDLARISGIKLLDTAEAYGDSQKIIGEYLKTQPLAHFKILSKFKNSPESSLNKHFDKMQQELGCESIYCYSYHQFKDVHEKELKTELIKMKNEGFIEKIGVSVYTNEEFKLAVDLDFIDIIQLPFNLLDNWSKRGELIHCAHRAGKEIHIRSIFLQGLFFKKLGEFPSNLTLLEKNVAELNELAIKANMNIGELALAYALSFPEINKVLIGVERVEQLNEILIMANKPLPESIKESITMINVKDEALIDPRNWK